MNVRAKFQCQSVRKYLDSSWNPETKQSDWHFLYEYEFSAVYGKDNSENEKFFASTPTGGLKMSAVRDDLFIPGENYYLDLSPAPK